jgi:hypothetical protein
VQRLEFFFWRIDERCFAERHDGAVVHRVVEDGAGQNEAIGKSDRDADGNSSACVSKHAARRGAMKINHVADAREQRGNHVRLAVQGKSDVAHVTFVENFVDGFAVVGAAMRFAQDARALGGRNGFWHESPHGETWRGARRFAAAHLIYSRRQSGMSEEQLQICYHAARKDHALRAAGSSGK